MGYPKPLEDLIGELKKLPSIGRVTAERLAFYLLNQPQEEVEKLSRAIGGIKRKIHHCKICYNFTEEDICEICRDPRRDHKIICTVSHPQDLLKIEKTGYSGLYHVLGGLISPLDNVSPENLHIEELLQRLKTGEVKEVILALDPKVEGEATTMYLVRKIKPLGVKATQIARGIPVGKDLELTDELTLRRAIQGRVEI
jgi:recombination protein RecR